MECNSEHGTLSRSTDKGECKNWGRTRTKIGVQIALIDYLNWVINLHALCRYATLDHHAIRFVNFCEEIVEG